MKPGLIHIHDIVRIVGFLCFKHWLPPLHSGPQISLDEGTTPQLNRQWHRALAYAQVVDQPLSPIILS
jgi:hypothetical protein